MFDINEYKIQFDSKENVKQFNDIFKDEIKNLLSKNDKDKNKYLSISFLGVLFRYYNNSMDIYQNNIQQKKNSPNGIINYYIQLKELYFKYYNKKNENTTI